MNIKIGYGIDIHQLRPNIPLILGGIHVPSDLGSKGHSDGDVVIHALVDSILGALCLGDIGTFFPSNDKRFKDADSRYFLKFANQKLKEKKFKISNIDINIILQSPKINKYVNAMKKEIANILDIDCNLISIKGKTADKLGFIGSNQGIMTTASILIYKNES
tara:strand:+ start:201 stop:686 length:486 start_codon:yes stop_codon:yes gene_type:complete